MVTGPVAVTAGGPSAVMIASLLLLSLSSACCLAANDNDKPINFPTRRTTEAANDKPIFFPNRRPQDHAEPLICPPVMNQRHAQNLSQLVRSNKFVNFDWNLIQELNSVEKGNIVISPLALQVVLAMLYEGAKGKTAFEIAEALDLTNTTSTPFRMTTRNRFSTILKLLEVFMPIMFFVSGTSEGEYDDGLKIGSHVFIDKNAEPKKDYQCTLRNYYNSAMQKVDFSNTTAAVNTINNWASSVIEGHIQHLISEADAHSSTIMLLLNAVYFKGFWDSGFPDNQTRFGPFYVDDRGSVDCALMNTTGRFAYYNITDINAQIIRLPYSGGKFAMYIVLPDRRSGLDNLTQALGPDRPLTGYLQNMTMTAINLILPRFDFNFTASLRPTLKNLGIKRMFTQEADLSDIANTSAGGDLIVSDVLQKAGISVREIGTVAYAATVAELMDKLGGDSEEVIHFRANHPFLFFIEDESTNTTVLVGKLTDPEQNGKTLSSPTPEPSVEGSNLFQTDEDTAVVEDPEYAENNGLICKSVSTAGGFYERSVHVSPRNIHRANGDRLSLKFMVQATSYVLITLSPTDIATEDATDRYHIGLGHNQSLILREREGVRTIKAENYTGNTLSGTKLQSFWNLALIHKDEHIILDINDHISGNIHLTQCNADMTILYHIGLGLGNNTFSVIQLSRGGLNTTMSCDYTGNRISGTELQSFWVRITQDGTILVGNGGEDLPFLEWRDPEPLTINYFSFGSFDNVTTKWLYDCSSSYENDETENNGLICKSVSTAGGFYERSVPVSPRNIHRANGDRLSLKFMVQATSNVLITLSPTDIVEENATDNYHIGLGHGNNYSAIWLESGGVRTIMAEDYTGNTLSGTELKSFWVRITQDGTILVGNGGEDLPFLTWHDPEPLTINYYSFGSVGNVTAKWLYDCPSSVENDETDNENLKCKSVYTTGNIYKPVFNVSWSNIHRAHGDRLSLRFMVQSRSDAHIVLLPTDSLVEDTPMYQIVLGGGKDMISVILLKHGDLTVKSLDPTRNRISGTELRSFWVRITQDGTIQLGNKGEDMPFLEWKDPEPLTINYFSFGSGFNVTAKWLYDCPASDENDETECGVSNKDFGEVLVPLIRNGVDVKQGEFPWMAALYHKKSEGWDQVCGGTLISPHIVLTAAHCVTSNAAVPLHHSDIYVGLGKLHRDFYHDEISRHMTAVRKVVVPQRYRGSVLLYELDIALLDLSTSVQSSPSIKPACLDMNNQIQLSNNTIGYVAGWGTTEDDRPSVLLQWASQRFIDYNTCVRKVGRTNMRLITNDKFCMASVNNASTDHGDSGGGLTFIQYGVHFVKGIVSTREPGAKGSVVFFTDLADERHRSWLREEKRKLDLDHK